MLQRLPYRLPLNTVKGFLEVYKTYKQGGIPFSAPRRMRSVYIWYAQDLFLRKPACWSLSLSATFCFILFGIVRLNTYRGIYDSSVIPL